MGTTGLEPYFHTGNIFVFCCMIIFRSRRGGLLLEAGHVQLVDDLGGARGPEDLALRAAAERHHVTVLVTT